jgi:uncharacterized protein YukE
VITYTIDDIQKVGQEIKKYKKDQKENIESVKRIVDHQTRHEKKKLEEALENYNKKLQVVLKGNEVKKYQEKIKNNHKEMEKLTEATSRFFHSEIEKIENNSSLSEEQKEAKINEVIEYISNQLMTEEEQEMFQQILQGQKKIFLLV